jgi:hypothetical protein
MKPLFAGAWVKWRGKLAPIKNNLRPKRFAKCALKTGMEGVVRINMNLEGENAQDPMPGLNTLLEIVTYHDINKQREIAYIYHI